MLAGGRKGKPKETNSQQRREDNTQRVLTQGVSSMVRSIADAASNPTRCGRIEFFWFGKYLASRHAPHHAYHP
jgi:hypothetical protein